MRRRRKRLQRTQRQYELKCAEGVHWSDADLLKSSECSTGPRLCIFLGPDLSCQLTGNLGTGSHFSGYRVYQDPIGKNLIVNAIV